MAVVAIGNYFQMEVDTDATKTMRQKGWHALVASGLGHWLLSFFVGELPNPAYSSRPMRGGKPIQFRDDLRSELVRLKEAPQE